jgi:cytochrome c-type biogenesis protein CcmF
MSDLGHFTLCLGWLLALCATVGGWCIGWKSPNHAGKVEFIRRVSTAVFLVLLVSIACLGYSFVTDDYSIQYVWQYSNKDMPWIYKITAIWGGMDGSMLLWCFLVSSFVGMLSVNSRSYPRQLVAWLLGFANSSTLFFLTITVFLTNPFRFIKAPFIPPDGNGLNPLLQNEYMAIHPPLLYLGFTGLAIPYAFAMAALCSGCISNEWTRLTRRWSLVAWSFLTAGIVLGGHWAYLELGWGGFWAWDPVENASFLPWLTATAFLHSVMVQERKGMLKTWNVSLMVLTYALTVFGTFLTRSGVVQSVHSFASTDIGWVFLAYLGGIILWATVMIVVRRKQLAPERAIESVFSREAVFLLNNLVLLSICFAVLWGVLFPVFSEAFTGVKQTVGIPFFNAVNVPLFLCLIFLMGIGPSIAWKRASIAHLKKLFLIPFLGALAIATLLVWVGIVEFYPVLSYALCFFALATIISEFGRGLKVQGATTGAPTLGAGSVVALFRRHHVKYGAHIIHFGVLVMTVSITASMAHKIEKEFTLAKGESFAVGRVSVQLTDFSESKNRNYEAIVAKAIVTPLKGGEPIAELSPELRFYPKNQTTTTEIALHMGAREDLYLVLAGLDPTGQKASMKIFINPFQIWLWYGAIIMVCGGFLVAVPQLGARMVRNRADTLPESVVSV